jgi:hypothetical protein
MVRKIGGGEENNISGEIGRHRRRRGKRKISAASAKNMKSSEKYAKYCNGIENENQASWHGVMAA